MEAIDKRIMPGSIVQVSNGESEWFGCVVTVEELKSFGVQAYLTVPNTGTAYVRLNWDEIVYVGEAAFVTFETNEDMHIFH